MVVIVCISDIIMAMADAATHILSWEEFQQIATEWNEDDESLIEFLMTESDQEEISIRSDCGSSLSSNEAAPEGQGNATYRKAFLLISAPYEQDVRYQKKTVKLTEEAAKQQYRLEFRNYWKIHPHVAMLQFPSLDKLDPSSNTHIFTYNTESILLQLSSVYSYDEMKATVKGFMEENGSKAMVAHVYFNGHGARLNDTQAQLTFKYPMKSNENLDTVQADMSNILNKSRVKLGRPNKLNLVFCQCHGHRRQEATNPLMDVVHFTTDVRPYSHARYLPATLVCDKILTMEDSHHVQLEEYAYEMQESRDALAKLKF